MKTITAKGSKMKSKRGLKLSEITIHRANKNKTLVGSVDLTELNEEIYITGKEEYILTTKGRDKIRKFLGK